MVERCIVCHKKIKSTHLEMYRCKCLQPVCKYHRFPDRHDCHYDFKQENSKALRSRMPVVKHDKINRI